MTKAASLSSPPHNRLSPNNRTPVTGSSTRLIGSLALDSEEEYVSDASKDARSPATQEPIEVQSVRSQLPWYLTTEQTHRLQIAHLSPSDLARFVSWISHPIAPDTAEYLAALQISGSAFRKLGRPALGRLADGEPGMAEELARIQLGLLPHGPGPFSPTTDGLFSQKVSPTWEHSATSSPGALTLAPVTDGPNAHRDTGGGGADSNKANLHLNADHESAEHGQAEPSSSVQNGDEPNNSSTGQTETADLPEKGLDHLNDFGDAPKPDRAHNDGASICHNTLSLPPHEDTEPALVPLPPSPVPALPPAGVDAGHALADSIDHAQPYPFSPLAQLGDSDTSLPIQTDSPPPVRTGEEQAADAGGDRGDVHAHDPGGLPANSNEGDAGVDDGASEGPGANDILETQGGGEGEGAAGRGVSSEDAVEDGPLSLEHSSHVEKPLVGDIDADIAAAETVASPVVSSVLSSPEVDTEILKTPTSSSPTALRFPSPVTNTPQLHPLVDFDLLRLPAFSLDEGEGGASRGTDLVETGFSTRNALFASGEWIGKKQKRGIATEEAETLCVAMEQESESAKDNGLVERAAVGAGTTIQGCDSGRPAAGARPPRLSLDIPVSPTSLHEELCELSPELFSPVYTNIALPNASSRVYAQPHRRAWSAVGIERTSSISFAAAGGFWSAGGAAPAPVQAIKLKRGIRGPRARIPETDFEEREEHRAQGTDTADLVPPEVIRTFSDAGSQTEIDSRGLELERLRRRVESLERELRRAGSSRRERDRERASRSDSSYYPSPRRDERDRVREPARSYLVQVASTTRQVPVPIPISFGLRNRSGSYMSGGQNTSSQTWRSTSTSSS
ncbi:hypothetical protein MKEN_00306400 [Mycena kentingensis (nom. inval.)]|nr:hypothetical protein MKEN_00306400 [Mycena kentingensis (nom. inval.)]